MQHLQPNTTLQGGKYIIERVLGQGGFGITYLARNVYEGKRVAVKELFLSFQSINDRQGNFVVVPNAGNMPRFEQQREKFKKEARRIMSLHEEHIVPVYDLFEENNTVYYVMEYVQGESLADGMGRQRRPFTVEEVKWFLPQLLDALQEIHSKGLWHLDLKPANIMMDNRGQVKIIDFGASKQLNTQKGGATSNTVISYTKGYAPREQMEENYEKIGPWTDFYALGASLYNLLTNLRPPMPTDIDDDSTDDKHIALPFPYDVSPDMRALVLWMMRTHRTERPSSVEEIHGFLNRPFSPHALMINNHEAVDLGLSVLWATMDVGASSEYDSGWAFLWGDPDGEKARKVSNSFFLRRFGSSPKINKICGNAQYDTATCLWGGNWRMPTGREFQELAEKCKWEVEDAYRVRIMGPNGNSILMVGNIHWTGEKPFGYITLFDWEYQQDGVKWSLFTTRVFKKTYAELFFPIRPVCDKNRAI